MSEPRALTNTYDIELDDRTIQLRLTIASQIRLKNKYKKETMDLIMDAASETEKLISVFDEALSYKGNTNEGFSGEELYDALVDNGIKGMDGFAEIVFNIANISGILSDKQSEQVNKGIKKTLDKVFDSLENADEKINSNNTEISDTESKDADTEATNTISFPEHS